MEFLKQHVVSLCAAGAAGALLAAATTMGGPGGFLLGCIGIASAISSVYQINKEIDEEELHEKQTTQTWGHLKSRLRAHENVAVQSHDNTNQATKAAAPKAAVKVNPVAAKMMQGMER